MGAGWGPDESNRSEGDEAGGGIDLRQGVHDHRGRECGKDEGQRQAEEDERGPEGTTRNNAVFFLQKQMAKIRRPQTTRLP